MTPELAALLDNQLITDVIYRYCRAIDRLDYALLETCFHPDATHDQGAYTGSSVAFCRYALEKLGPVRATHHQTGNVLIVLDGDVAHSETYWTAFHRLSADGGGSGLFRSTGIEEDLVIGGRYVDRFERRAGKWRIAHRFGVYDWQRYEPACDRGFGEHAGQNHGIRGPDDRAYWRG